MEVIEFSYPLFILISIVIFCFMYFFKKRSLFYALCVGLYISFVICMLFFPFVLDPGGVYHFGEELRWAVDFYLPSSKLRRLPEYTLFHFALFIPFGFILKKEFSFKKTIMISIVVIFGIENIQLLINFLSYYVQYAYDFGDIIIHLCSTTIGILIYYPVHYLYPHIQKTIMKWTNIE